MPNQNLLSLIVGRILGKSSGLTSEQNSGSNPAKKALDKTRKPKSAEAYDTTKNIKLD